MHKRRTSQFQIWNWLCWLQGEWRCWHASYRNKRNIWIKTIQPNHITIFADGFVLDSLDSGAGYVFPDLARQTRGRKVAGSNPGRRGGRIFFSRVNVLCWLISVSVPPPHYRVARKRSGHSAQSAGGRLQLNTHAPYVCGYAWSDAAKTGAWLYDVHRTCAETVAVVRGTSHATAK